MPDFTREDGEVVKVGPLPFGDDGRNVIEATAGYTLCEDGVNYYVCDADGDLGTFKDKSVAVVVFGRLVEAKLNPPPAPTP